jgi:hypothetical protein
MWLGGVPNLSSARCLSSEGSQGLPNQRVDLITSARKLRFLRGSQSLGYRLRATSLGGEDGIKMTNRMLRAGSRFLYSWSGLNLLVSSLILTIVVFHYGNSPLLAMVFEESEIARLGARVISALNCLTILYNSYAIALSVLACFVIRFGLGKGQKWAFWALLITIGFVEILAFIASAPLGNVRWQVNVVLSALYVVGIGLSGYSLFARRG